MFSFSAISRTASGKVMFSIFCTKAKTSPEAPQPKQWKNCRVACTENDGDLFLMERTEALEVLRAALAQLDVLAHDADDVSLLLDGVRKIPGVGHRLSLQESEAICQSANR